VVLLAAAVSSVVVPYCSFVVRRLARSLVAHIPARTEGQIGCSAYLHLRY
jgi:hypothetical protein